MDTTPNKPYTVRLRAGDALQHVTRSEGLDLVAGKRATWEPPLPEQIAKLDGAATTAAPAPTGE